MKKLLVVFAFAFALSAVSQNNILPKDIQIKTASLAAPEMYRDSATVLGYNAEGKLVTLREGTNGMICLADDPNKKGISVACYAAELEPFMARGRALVAEGKSIEEKWAARKKEIEENSLTMPEEPSMVYIVAAEEEDLNKETGMLENSKIRYVLYKPYMTGESTGLPTKPETPGMPWLMDAGTHRSHIMITPAPTN